MVETNGGRPPTIPAKDTILIVEDDLGVATLERRRLEESEKRFRELLENLQVGVVLMDPQSKILLVNQAALDLLGLTKEQMLGKPFLDFDWNTVRENGSPLPVEEYPVPRASTTGQPVRNVVMGLDRAVLDDRVWLLVNAEPQLDAHGGVQQVICTFSDITERKRMEEALRDSEVFAHSTLNSLSAHIAIVDESGIILAVNEAWRDFAKSNGGMGQGVAEGANYLGVCDSATGAWSEEAPAFAGGIRSVLSGQSEEFTLEYPCHSPTEHRWFVGRVTRFPDGGLPRVVIAHENITERKQAEEVRLLLASIVESSHDAILSNTLAGTITSWNAGACKLYGYSEDEVLGRHISLLVPPDHTDEIPKVLEKVRRGETVDYRETVHITKDGRRLDVSITISPIKDLGGGIAGASVICRDITERKLAETEKLRLSGHVQRLLESIDEGIYGIDVQGICTFVNRAAARMLGYEPEELLGRHIHETVHHTHEDGSPYPSEECPIYHAFREERGVKVDEEVFWRKDGTKLPVEYSSYPVVEGGKCEGAIVTFVDVTERKRAQEMLSYQAFHDPLTSLPNRVLFLDRLEQALVRADRREGCVAVLFLDLDRFKVVNDSLGHEAGDKLLIDVGERLRGCLRSEDTVARLGGDEFVVLLQDIAGRGYAERAAERIAAALGDPFDVQGNETYLTVSIGIALNAPDHDSPSDMLRDADIAMYSAKDAGKAHHRLFDGSMKAYASKRLQLENRLRWAIKHGEMRVYYQPKVDLSSGEIVGMEALVRWEDPARGLVSPAEFIPLAEETGLILPLGRWVLREACQQAKDWQERYPGPEPLVMAVNLSAKQFQQPNLAEEVAGVLRETGLDPDTLFLEITETSVMKDAQTNMRTLQTIKALGVRVAIDDFGTGYSSLGYLKRFPVDMIKIDRSFVSGLGRDAEDTAIVETVVLLARALNMRAVAEGIETAEQVSLLRTLGCPIGQGYYFAKPMPPDEAGKLLVQNVFG